MKRLKNSIVEPYKSSTFLLINSIPVFCINPMLDNIALATTKCNKILDQNKMLYDKGLLPYML
jgi:hypothetical protein